MGISDEIEVATMVTILEVKAKIALLFQSSLTPNVSRKKTAKKPAKKCACTFRVFVFACFLVPVVILLALSSLVALPPSYRFFHVKQ